MKKQSTQHPEGKKRRATEPLSRTTVTIIGRPPSSSSSPPTYPSCLHSSQQAVEYPSVVSIFGLSGICRHSKGGWGTSVFLPADPFPSTANEWAVRCAAGEQACVSQFVFFSRPLSGRSRNTKKRYTHAAVACPPRQVGAQVPGPRVFQLSCSEVGCRLGGQIKKGGGPICGSRAPLEFRCGQRRRRGYLIMRRMRWRF